MRIKSIVVKRSISLSKVVADWADDMADRKGHGTNFSAYIADLIRRDKEREDELRLLFSAKKTKSFSPGLAAASDQVVSVIEEMAQNSRGRKKKS